MLYHLEEILSLNLIYRMLGIDSGITEKSGSKHSISEWRNLGMANRRNGESSEWQTLRIFGMADLWNGEVYRPVPAIALRFPLHQDSWWEEAGCPGFIVEIAIV